jgi:hypothetical protein
MNHKPFQNLNSLLISTISVDSSSTKELHSILISHRKELRLVFVEDSFFGGDECQSRPLFIRITYSPYYWIILTILLDCIDLEKVMKIMYLMVILESLGSGPSLSFSTQTIGNVLLDGKVQQVNDAYKKGVGLVVELLNLNGVKASALYDSSSGSDDTSIIANCIYSYFGERESLFGCLEIMLKYADHSKSDDPIPTIGRTIQEIFDHGSSSSCVESLLKLIFKNSKKIEGLSPLPNDSTTQACIII